MLYGSASIPEFQSRLSPALAWKSRTLLVRDVPAGRTVSYGRTFTTSRPMRIATLAVGYADGYPRQASNRGACVLVGGRRCPLLGRVTMDQILVDVSDVPAADVCDEAVLIGTQGSETILAAELADWAGTIAWHVFTGIGGRTKRLPS
jgi:alanine racemase